MPYMGYRRHRMGRRRRYKGRGLGSWLSKAGSWISRSLFPGLKNAGSTALKMYSNPAVRGLADHYAGDTAKKYMSKADEVINVANILKGAMGNGRRRRTIRLHRKKKYMGMGLAMY